MCLILFAGNMGIGHGFPRVEGSPELTVVAVELGCVSRPFTEHFQFPFISNNTTILTTYQKLGNKIMYTTRAIPKIRFAAPPPSWPKVQPQERPDGRHRSHHPQGNKVPDGQS